MVLCRTPHHEAYSWHERSTDTPANRCIKAAMEVVHEHLMKAKAQPRKGDSARLARLAGHFRAFDDVGADPDQRFLDDPQVLGLSPLPDPRAFYRPILDLAVLIVRGLNIALEVGGDDVRFGSMLINTNELFEKFVRVSLAKHARKQGWPVDVLDGNTEGRVDLYDVPDEPPAPQGTPLTALATRDPGKAQPDLVIRALDGTVPLVAEVKNTIVSDEALPDRGHVEQAVTYALRYGLDFTLLIHPWSKGTKGLVYVGRVRSIDVYDYRLDLSSDEGTDEALNDLAAVVASLAKLPTVGSVTTAASA
jgi:5-methylcytosine-specific restriction enzyme subunit McrC